MSIATTLLALLIEATAGYPERVLRAIGHPVIWIGRLISVLDRMLNRPDSAWRKAAGFLALFVIIAVPAVAACVIERALLLLPLGFALVALLASTLIAQRSLYEHVERVADALENGGLEAGRAAVSQIVGRDPQSLDEAGVARAAIESLAENFSDGVVAPVFWLGVGGLSFGVAYKAINTADSMIGHKNEKYREFGYASARLDDLVNLPASRLSALLIAAAAAVTDRDAAWRAWETVTRDARKHRSPNAGWPEAAMAGALGLSLAGPRAYGGIMVEDAFMGDGRREASAQDIRAALALYRRAAVILIALVALIAIIALR
ncbi:MAG: adenosylcobinamide-phosphate synthase CbiB [Xanthobacteraceae bacterium]|nr:adenosylcobinamide-phosphate synthase CbiB [Xanthobacteraceae bacterium]